MAGPRARLTDPQVETFLGQVLRTGVLVAAAVVLLGGILYLGQYGGATIDRRVFRSEPADLRSLSGIIHDASTLDSRGVIQLGLLLLVATPVARVFFSIIAFLIERDLMYVLISLFVLLILLLSLGGWIP